MENIDNTILGIAEAENFNCIGSNCPDTCCAGWQVNVDKFTYNKWQDPRTAQVINPHLNVLNNTDPNSLDAAQIKLSPNGRCSFLRDDNLCKLQADYDHSHLSYVCRSFPRSRNSFFGIKEENLSLACPEAARLILSPKDPLQIKLQDNPVNELNILNISYPKQNEIGLIDTSLAWELRTLIFKIIQFKSVKLSHRITALGLIAKNLEEEFLNNKSKDEAFSKVIGTYSMLFSNPSYFENLTKNIPSSHEIKILFLKVVFSVLAPYEKSNIRFKSYLDKIKDVFAISVISDSAALIDKYKLVTNKSLNSIPAHILENYVFHLIVKEIFPFNHKAPSTQFLEISLRYYLIHELVLAFCYANGNKVSESEIIALVQCFTKLYEHTPEVQEKLKEITLSASFNSIPHMCILLQD